MIPLSRATVNQLIRTTFAVSLSLSACAAKTDRQTAGSLLSAVDDLDGIVGRLQRAAVDHLISQGTVPRRDAGRGIGRALVTLRSVETADGGPHAR